MDVRHVRKLTGNDLPPELRALPSPPRDLYVLGTLPRPDQTRVAIVGSRNASESARRCAYDLGRELARAEVVVVSGLARGVDAAAHRGALDASGITVGFLGSGPDVIYPKTSRDIARGILARGALVSEYPPSSPPLPYRFVARNRLVAGYARGTVVVEAGTTSGALITAGFTVEYGRQLWVVPGDPRRPGCRGSNRLLRDGAGVALDASDVLIGLGLISEARFGPEAGIPPGLSAGEAKVWRSLADFGVCEPERLTRHARIPASEVLKALSLLEIAGHVEKSGEGYVLTPRRS